MATPMRCIVATARGLRGEGAVLAAPGAPVAPAAQAVAPGEPAVIAGTTGSGWHPLWPFVLPLGNERWRQLWLAEKYVAREHGGPEVFETLDRPAARALVEEARV